MIWIVNCVIDFLVHWWWLIYAVCLFAWHGWNVITACNFLLSVLLWDSADLHFLLLDFLWGYTVDCVWWEVDALLWRALLHPLECLESKVCVISVVEDLSKTTLVAIWRYLGCSRDDRALFSVVETLDVDDMLLSTWWQILFLNLAVIRHLVYLYF